MTPRVPNFRTGNNAAGRAYANLIPSTLAGATRNMQRTGSPLDPISPAIRAARMAAIVRAARSLRGT
jgi:hypothetical protein